MKNKFIFTVFILAMFGLAYFKDTYVLNFSSEAHPLLIKRYYSADIYQLARPGFQGNPNPRTSSVIFYHLLFAGVNAAFIFLIFKKGPYVLTHLTVFSGLTAILAALYVFYIRSEQDFLYRSSLLIKDFLQSPVYSFIFVIIAFYYPRLKTI